MASEADRQALFDSAVAKGVPPDPRQVGPLCREVDHDGLMVIERDESGSILRHTVTGECVKFDGREVSLHTHGKRCFVQVGDTTAWVSKLLKKAVFECVADARRFIYERRPDGFQRTWLSELQRQHVDGALKFHRHGAHSATLSYLVFPSGRPSGPCSVFWNLRSVQQSLQLEGLSTGQQQIWIRAGMSKTWDGVLRKAGCEDSDQLAFYNGKLVIADTGPELVTMHHTVSTRALLVLLAHWCRTFEAEADRASALSVLESMLASCCAGRCEVIVDDIPPLVRARGIQALRLVLIDSCFKTCDLRSHPWWKLLPSPRRSAATFMKDDTAGIAHLIVFASRFAALSDFFAALVGGVSVVVESGIRTKALLNPGEAEPAAGGELLGHRRDPVVRKQMRKLLMTKNIGKNYAALGKTAQSLGMKNTTHSYDSHADLFRYWLASRRLLACDVHIAIVADGGRFGGRERLATGVLGLDCGLACWAPPQDLSDTARRLDVDQPLGQAEQAQWVADSMDYLAARRDTDEQARSKGNCQKRRKLHRVASYRHLKHIDAQLMSIFGKRNGLSRFLPTDGDRFDPLTTPLLVLTEDEHSVNVCAQWYMLYHQKARLYTRMDPWHRIWNDCSDGARRAGFQLVIQLTSLCMNLPYGPWEGAKFFQEISEAGAEYLQVTSADDPLLDAIVASIQDDFAAGSGWEIVEDRREWAIEQLRAAAFLQRKGCHISSTRWFDWNTHFKAWSEEWGLRLLCLIYYGIVTGFLNRSGGAMVMQDLHKRIIKTAESSKAKTVAEGRTSIQQVRDRCKNGLHVSALIHSERSIKQYAHMISATCDGFTIWFQKWNQKCRSRSGSLAFHTSVAHAEEPLQTVLSVFAPCADVSALMSFGFLGEELLGPSFAKMTVTDDVVQTQDDLAIKLDRLQWSLAPQRMNSLCRVWFIPPRCFAGLLIRGDIQEWYLQRLRSQWEAYSAACSSSMPFFKNIVARSPFQWTFVKDIVGWLRLADWKVNDALYTLLEKIHSDWGTTTPVEVSFQKNRQAERERPDKLVSNLRCWQKPIARKVLEQDFHFKEIDPSVVPEQHGRKPTSIPKAFFSAPTKFMSMKFEGLATHASKAHNPSFSPDSSFALVEDLMLTEFLHSKGLMTEGPRSWRSKLLVPGLLVFCKRWFPDKVFFTIVCHGHCWCLWPAVRTKVGIGAVYQLAPIKFIGDLVWAPVLKFSDWTILPSAPVSLAHLFILSGKQMPPEIPASLRLQVEKRPRPMLEVAASEGFWDIGRDPIDSLLKDEYGMSIEEKMSFADRLGMAVMAVLECDKEKAALILEKRCVEYTVVSEVEDILECEEASGMMQKQEQMERDKFVEDQARRRASQSSIKEWVKTHRAQTRRSGANRNAVQFPGDGPGAIDAEMLNRDMCPPNYRIRRDQFNARWIIRQCGSAWTFSKSWGAGAESTCTRLCLLAAWRRHESLTGERCRVVGLQE